MYSTPRQDNRSNNPLSDEALLDGHWGRVVHLKQSNDPRALFEALFDYIETHARINGISVRELGTLKSFEELYSQLEADKRYVRFASIVSGYKFLAALKALRQLCPIVNNSRPEQRVFLTKKNSITDFLGALIVVRNNLRHGDKEYTPRSEKIIGHFNECVGAIVWNLQSPKERKREDLKRQQERSVRERKDILRVSVIVSGVVLAIWLLYTIGDGETSTVTVDCNLNPGLCQHFEERRYDMEQMQAHEDALMFRGF